MQQRQSSSGGMKTTKPLTSNQFNYTSKLWVFEDLTLYTYHMKKLDTGNHHCLILYRKHHLQRYSDGTPSSKTPLSWPREKNALFPVWYQSLNMMPFKGPSSEAKIISITEYDAIQRPNQWGHNHPWENFNQRVYLIAGCIGQLAGPLRSKQRLNSYQFISL